MLLRGGVRGYGVYGTFNNISVMSWWSLLVVEETAVTGHWQTLSHNVVSSIPRHEWDSNLQL